MRQFLCACSIGLIASNLGFAWAVWLSPQARLGKRNWHYSYRVRPSMGQREALAIMGPAQATKPNPFNSRETIYTYAGPPLAASEVAFWIGPDSVVLGVSHGDN